MMDDLTPMAAQAAPIAASMPAPSDPMLSMLNHVVTTGGDIEKMRELLALKREYDADEARKAFHAAFAACQAQIPAVVKNKRNEHTRSMYADLAAIEQAAMPIIARHGLSVRFYPVLSTLDGHYGVDCVVSHEKGHSETYHADVPMDGAGQKGGTNKTATHAFGSTMTYGRRYLMCMIFNIATGDDDGNSSTKADTGNANITEDQFRQLQDLIDKAGADEGVVLASEKISALHFLPQRRFDGLSHKLNQSIKAKAGQQ